MHYSRPFPVTQRYVNDRTIRVCVCVFPRLAQTSFTDASFRTDLDRSMTSVAKYYVECMNDMAGRGVYIRFFCSACDHLPSLQPPAG